MQAPRRTSGDGDGDSREDAGDERDQHRGTDVPPRHEHRCHERADDRPQVVAGTFDPEGTTVGTATGDGAEHRIAGRGATAAGCPCDDPESGDLPHHGRQTDEGRRDGRDGVAAGRDAAAPGRIIGHRPGGDLRDPRAGVADAVDQSESGRRSTQRRRYEGRQHTRHHLVAGVGEEARGAHRPRGGSNPSITPGQGSSRTPGRTGRRHSWWPAEALARGGSYGRRRHPSEPAGNRRRGQSLPLHARSRTCG